MERSVATPFVGPGYTNFDIALIKDTPFGTLIVFGAAILPLFFVIAFTAAGIDKKAGRRP